MRDLHIFLFEWKHFVRSRFKVIACILFVLAGVYGLHSGSELYHERLSEIEKIEKRVEENQQEHLAKYVAGKVTDEDRPWINMSEPFWAVWFADIHHFKRPSAAMVYSTGQSEQYGYYKRITFNASPYDEDLAEEIANPERLQTGKLDFAFVIIFLLPLVLLVLMYNLRGTEVEQGIMPLVEVQKGAGGAWLLSRVAFYFALSIGIVGLLLLYGAMLTGVFDADLGALWDVLYSITLYGIFWSVVFFLILRKGRGILGNTLKMMGVWLLFSFVIPATVHQVVSIASPVNLMTDLIDADRDQKYALYDEPNDVVEAKLFAMFPEIKESPIAKDSTKIDGARNDSYSALVNELKKKGITKIEKHNTAKNQLVQNTYWFNPVGFFQNRLNRISQTHFDDYQKFRDEIQYLVDKQIRTLVHDTWNGKEIRAKDFQFYMHHFSQVD